MSMVDSCVRLRSYFEVMTTEGRGRWSTQALEGFICGTDRWLIAKSREKLYTISVREMRYPFQRP